MGTIWKEQIDTALLRYIPSIVNDPKEDRKDLKSFVTIRKPDEDFKIEEYPRITVYNTYDIPDYIRMPTPNYPTVIEKDYDTAYLDEPPQQYTLLYQIDFWSTLQKHMNDMTREWIQTGRVINLDVKDMTGNDRNRPLIRQGNIMKLDLLRGSERIYHSFITYRVWVELQATPIEEFLVKEIITQTN